MDQTWEDCSEGKLPLMNASITTELAFEVVMQKEVLLLSVVSATHPSALPTSSSALISSASESPTSTSVGAEIDDWLADPANAKATKKKKPREVAASALKAAKSRSNLEALHRRPVDPTTGQLSNTLRPFSSSELNVRGKRLGLSLATQEQDERDGQEKEQDERDRQENE